MLPSINPIVVDCWTQHYNGSIMNFARKNVGFGERDALVACFQLDRDQGLKIALTPERLGTKNCGKMVDAQPWEQNGQRRRNNGSDNLVSWSKGPLMTAEDTKKATLAGVGLPG